jgi:hypothetical protein
MNKVAIGRVVLTNREHIIALDPLDKVGAGAFAGMTITANILMWLAIELRTFAG